MALDRLISDQTTFLEQWDREVVCSHNLGPFDDIFTAEAADDLLDHGLRLPFVRLIKDSQELDTTLFTRPLARGRTDDAIVQGEIVRRYVAEGMTLAIAGVEQCWRPLTRFCRELAGDVGFDMHAGVYLSPPSSRGAGAHYDIMSVFIRQVWGYKHWQVREPFTWWPAKKWEEGMPTNTPVVLEATLAPGDCLYVPRGFIHDGWTTNSGSLHLTFSGAKPVTWADVWRRAVGSLGEERLHLRGTLPLRAHQREAALHQAIEEARTAFQVAISEIDAEALAKNVVGLVLRPAGEPGTSPQLAESLLKRSDGGS